jgi:hypothetical protein
MWNMKAFLMKGGLCFAAVAIGLGQPAHAAIACWDQQHADAAKIRDLQSKLMVATLRCQAMGINVLSAYNDFVRSSRDTLAIANDQLRQQFAFSFGKTADKQYDSFATALANAYGASETNAAVCDGTAAAAQDAAAAAGDASRLLEIADRLGGPAPELPGGVCGALGVETAAQ